MAAYIELHCHTNLSFLDGASHPGDVLARAADIGMPALAVTDHDGLYGAITFYKEAKRLGIKPVIGAEVTLEGGHHLTLLARDNRGYSNLCRLITHAQLAHSKGKAVLDPATLAGHSSGLFCLSGCKKGEIASLLMKRKGQEALDAAQRYIRIFGRDGFFIELQNNLCPEDMRVCRSLVEIADGLGLEYVATNNVHYARPEDHRLQDVLVCIKNRTTLDESRHLRRPNSEFYLKPAEDMSRLFREYPRALENSVRIAGECNVDMDFSGYRFPEFPLPPGETRELSGRAVP